MRPACESGFLTEANEAPEDPINRKCCGGISLIVMVTSWCLLASWRSRLASCKFSMVAELMDDCKWDNLLDRSGRVLTAAYWSDPIDPLKSPRSLSVTCNSGWVLR